MVEYILLLVIAVSIATLVVKTWVSRNESDPGVVVQFWDDMLKVIGADNADEPN